MAGDYFDNGSIQHLSHDILDMLQYYDMATAGLRARQDGTFVQRVQYMFHAPEIAPGNADQFTDGGGPAFLPNANRGPGYARRTAQGIGTNIDFRTGQREHRMGHLSCLQRSSRAADGTPVHIRMDGPGFDSMDVPGGSRQPKLQFTIFVPSADFFSRLRVSQASLDLQAEFGVPRRTTGWSGSSPPPGGRTSSARRAGTGPSRWPNSASSPGGEARRRRVLAEPASCGGSGGSSPRVGGAELTLISGLRRGRV